jgi:hypothetical protein
MTTCNYRILSEHSTSLGRVAYQVCEFGHFRIQLDGEVVKDGPPSFDGLQPSIPAGLTAVLAAG